MSGTPETGFQPPQQEMAPPPDAGAESALEAHEPSPESGAESAFEAVEPAQLEAQAELVVEQSSQETAAFQQASQQELVAAGVRAEKLGLGAAEVQALAAETKLPEQLAELDQEAAALRDAAAVESKEAAKPDIVGLKDDYSQDQLDKLRKKTSKDYPDHSLVSKNHEACKDAKADKVACDEAAQAEAFGELNRLLEGEDPPVRPDSITSDMLDRLQLRGNKEVTIESHKGDKEGVVKEIGAVIGKELQAMVEQGFVKKEEAELIQAEAGNYAAAYAEAYPDADPQQVLVITRDNARKLAYQTERDKDVFSGSDHGTRHILEGNMKMADKMMDGLGDKISAKDKVLIRQIIIDHDLGYTVGVAQANKSFDASKDHPLFSTKFVESNQEYYQQMFGKDGFEAVRDGILQHSYPKSEYDKGPDPKTGINMDLVRSVTSTVDALGTTAETKSPAFFRNPDAMKVLAAMRLFADTLAPTVLDKKGKPQKQIPDANMARFKAELTAIAEQEPDETRKEAFKKAIAEQFNQTTMEMTIPQFTGVLRGIEMRVPEGATDGKIKPHVKMDVSRAQALINGMFGDADSVRAFEKAMGDFGVSKAQFEGMAKTIRLIRAAETPEERQTLMKKLRFESGSAVFEISPDYAEGKGTEADEVFESVERLSIRNEMRDLMEKLKNPENRTEENMESLHDSFMSSISDQVDREDLSRLSEMLMSAQRKLDQPAEFEQALQQIGSFVTKQERSFMENPLAKKPDNKTPEAQVAAA